MTLDSFSIWGNHPMNTEKFERKLSAILSADAKSYGLLRHLSMTLIVIATGLLMLGCSSGDGSVGSDLVIMNAKVFTSNASNPWAQAVAVNEGRIAYVGDDSGVRAYVGSKTHVVDANGNMLTPGFIDNHCHVLWIGALQALMTKELYKATSVDEIRTSVQKYADNHLDHAIVMGVGWKYEYIPGGMPDKDIGDSIISDRPMLLMSYGGNSGWLNSMAVEQLEKRNATAFNHLAPAVDSDGNYTGVLLHFHAFNPLDFYSIEELGTNIKRKMFDEITRILSDGLSYGVTGYNDVQIYKSFIPMLLEFREQGGLDNVRARGSYYVGSHSLEDEEGLKTSLTYWKSLYTDESDAHLVLGDSVKLYIEGVFDSHTCLLLNPYSDEPNNYGEAVWTQEDFNKVVQIIDGMGIQCCTHASGDGGIRRVINAYENAIKINGYRDARHRLDHCDLPEPTQDQPRMVQLGIYAAMQPNHFFGNSNAETLLGFDRMQRFEPWGSLEKLGINLSFGSDWAAGLLNPIYGLFLATQRLNYKFEDNWGPGEKILIENAMRHYTIDSANALRLGKEIGSIEVGKYGDFALFNIDLRTIASDWFIIEHLIHVEGMEVTGWEDFVEMTVVGGKIVYQKNGEQH